MEQGGNQVKTGIMLLGVVGVVSALGAQPHAALQLSGQPAVAAGRPEQVLHLQQMEQALEDAVARSIEIVQRQLNTEPSGLVFFAGSIQVRGFVLDDYGFFFDVEYPVVRRTLLWSMTMLDRMDGGMSATFRELRRRLEDMPDGHFRLEFDRVLTEVEAEFLPPDPAPPGLSVSGSGTAGPARLDELDPRALYREALTEELASVLGVYGAALGVSDDEWVSIAARDARGRLGPSRGPATRDTLTLRVHGGDLAALATGRLSAVEFREAVAVDVR